MCPLSCGLWSQAADLSLLQSLLATASGLYDLTVATLPPSADYVP